MTKTLLSRLGGIALAGLAALAPGCVRPVVENQKTAYHKIGVGEFSEKDIKHKGKLLAVMGNWHMPQVTADGRDALFKIKYAEREFALNEKGKAKWIKVHPGEKVNGEKGIYVIKQEELTDEELKKFPKAKDKFVDYLDLEMYGNRGTMAQLTEYLSAPELATKKMTEQDCKFRFGEITLPKLGDCWVFAENTIRHYPETDEKTLESGIGYNFYVIPKAGARVLINSKGGIRVIHENSIFKPYFVSFDEINENVRKKEAKRLAKIEAAKNAKEQAKRDKHLERQARRGKGPHKPRIINRGLLGPTKIQTKPKIKNSTKGLFSKGK